jgi:hypothetical protein
MLNNEAFGRKIILFLVFAAGMLVFSGCRTTPKVTQTLILDGSKIEINDKLENIVSSDGTKCTMVFEMEAQQANSVYKGKAMLQTRGVKDVGGEIPATAMIGMVSKMEFLLAQPKKEATTGSGVELVPLADLDYEGSGTFHFVLTDSGFMALEEKIQDDDLVIDIPYRVIIFKNTAIINFTTPDGTSLSFKGKFTPMDLDLAPLKK